MKSTSNILSKIVFPTLFFFNFYHLFVSVCVEKLASVLCCAIFYRNGILFRNM